MFRVRGQKTPLCFGKHVIQTLTKEPDKESGSILAAASRAESRFNGVGARAPVRVDQY